MGTQYVHSAVVTNLGKHKLQIHAECIYLFSNSNSNEKSFVTNMSLMNYDGTVAIIRKGKKESINFGLELNPKLFNKFTSGLIKFSMREAGKKFKKERNGVYFLPFHIMPIVD